MKLIKYIHKFIIGEFSWCTTKHSIKWNTNVGDFYRKTLMKTGLFLMSSARKCLKVSGGRCSWCGRNCGFDSSVSRKGLRCIGCTDK